jgi:hypothetical protein
MSCGKIEMTLTWSISTLGSSGCDAFESREQTLPQSFIRAACIICSIWYWCGARTTHRKDQASCILSI